MKKLYVIAIAAAFALAPSIARAQTGDFVSVRVISHVCGASGAASAAGVFDSTKNLSKFKGMLSSCKTSAAAGSGAGMMVRMHSKDGTKSDVQSGGLVKSEICEWELQGGDDKETSRACYDASYYSFDNMPKGKITVMQTSGADGASIVGFNPDFLNGNDAASLVSFGPGIVNLDTRRDEDGIVTLHIFNVQSAKGADGRDGAPGADGDSGADGQDSASIIKSTVDSAIEDAAGEAVHPDKIERVIETLKGMVSDIGDFFTRA